MKIVNNDVNSILHNPASINIKQENVLEDILEKE